MFGRHREEPAPETKDIGLLGTDTHFEGSIRFAGTLRIDGTVLGNISSQPGSGSVLIVNQQAVVKGDVVSDSVLISGHVEGEVHARERVEIFRTGVLKGDVHTGGIMIEGGAEFHGYCHMTDAQPAAGSTPGPAGAQAPGSTPEATDDAPPPREALPEAAPPPGANATA